MYRFAMANNFKDGGGSDQELRESGYQTQEFNAQSGELETIEPESSEDNEYETAYSSDDDSYGDGNE